MVVQKRPSIHQHDKKLDSEQETNEKLLQCESCKKKFTITEDRQETELVDSQNEEYVLKKKLDNVDFEKLSSFKCKGCKQPEVIPSSRSSFRWPLIWLVVLIGILVFVIFIFYANRDEIVYTLKKQQDIPINMKVKSEDLWLDNKLAAIEQLYGRQHEDTWITFSAGIKSVMNEPNKPSAFLLLFDSETAGKTAECIVKDVSKQALPYIMHKEDTLSVINGADLNQKQFLEDPGQFLKEINDTVRAKGALVVTNLHQVPPNVARMFHYLCDTYTPLVEKAIVFFTLKVKQLPSIKDQKKTADETMVDLWSSELADNVLRPLITRMTTNVVLIHPDNSC